MTRIALPLVTLLLLALAPTPAAAQRVGLEVTLTPDTVVDGRRMRLPKVRTTNLLAGRWGDALRRSLPLRLHYQIEIWRSRPGWIDRHERMVEWGVVVRHEALFDQYTVTHPQAVGVQEVTLTTWEALDQYLATESLILARPAEAGTYYFHVKLQVTNLSDADVDALERFVRGESAPGDRDRAPAGRSALRFLMRMTGGLQYETVERRSETFIVR